jgi:hypothetical protein
LYDFCDQSTIDRLTPTQIACLESEFGNCLDGTVNITNTDSDPIATVTVASGGTEAYEIPNVAWTQSDGSPQSTPYGDAISCAPCGTPPPSTITNALNFDGVNDYGVCVPIVEITSPFSISFWYKLNDTSRYNGIMRIMPTLGIVRSLIVGAYPNGDITFQTSSFPINYTGFNDNNWHHITITAGSVAKIYLDGVLAGSQPLPNLFFDRVELGVVTNWQSVTGASVYGNISLADLAFHDAELTQQQITDMQVLGTTSGDEVARWAFDEPVGTTSGKLTDYILNQKMSIRNMTSGFGIIDY